MSETASVALNFRHRDEENLRFLQCLCSRDVNSRNQGFEIISKTLDSWVDGYGSPPTGNAGSAFHINGIDHKSVIEEYLLDILRLSFQCPFDDVRERCEKILMDIQERATHRGIRTPRRLGQGPSHFISAKEIVSVNTSDENTQMLFVDAFLQNNRLDHITHVMGYHPQYLDSFLRTQQFLLRGDGPLPYDYRHYIAIMATARHQCTYLVTLYIQEFILVGGDPTWLKGLSYIPKKLQDIYEVNKILAHRPWLLSSSHIEKLIKADDNWSVSELMHALILLAHFHSLCSFVRGCGINAEIDLDGGYTFRPLSMSESEDSNDSTDFTNGDICDNSYEGSVEHLMKQMREITDDIDEISQDELIKRFESVEHQNAELHLTNAQPSPNQEILKFVDDPQFIYEDFTKRETDIPTFRAQNFSWEEHGFSLANRLYNEIGNLLDEKFRQAYNLTYYTMGDNKDVDTTAFRTAVWNYIHCIFGIRHDDYDYGAINQLLEKNLKAYVKTVTCYPERLSKKDYDLVMREFKHSEKVHVHLMLYEARMQAELLYSLRAVMKYLT